MVVMFKLKNYYRFIVGEWLVVCFNGFNIYVFFLIRIKKIEWQKERKINYLIISYGTVLKQN